MRGKKGVRLNTITNLHLVLHVKAFFQLHDAILVTYQTDKTKDKQFHTKKLAAFARTTSDSFWFGPLAYPSNDIGVHDGYTRVPKEVGDGALPRCDASRQPHQPHPSHLPPYCCTKNTVNP